MRKTLLFSIFLFLSFSANAAAEIYLCETIGRAMFQTDDVYKSSKKPDFVFSIDIDDGIIRENNAIATFPKVRDVRFEGDYKVTAIRSGDELSFYSTSLNHFIKFEYGHILLVDWANTIVYASCQKYEIDFR